MEKDEKVNQEMVNPASTTSERVYEPSAVHRAEHSEGALTRLMEQQAAKLPSDTFLIAAFGAIGLSFYYYIAGQKERSSLVGIWAPTLLTMGVYNKLVKLLNPR